MHSTALSSSRPHPTPASGACATHRFPRPPRGSSEGGPHPAPPPPVGVAMKSPRRASLPRPAAARIACSARPMSALSAGLVTCTPGILENELPQALYGHGCDAGARDEHGGPAGHTGDCFVEPLGIHDAAGHWLRSCDRHLHTPQVVEIPDRRAQRRGAEGQGAERGVRRTRRAIRHGPAAPPFRRCRPCQTPPTNSERRPRPRAAVQPECGISVDLRLVLEIANTGRRQHHPLEPQVIGERGRDGDDEQHREEEARDGTLFGRARWQRPTMPMPGGIAATRERLQPLRAALRLDREMAEAVKQRRHAV